MPSVDIVLIFLGGGIDLNWSSRYQETRGWESDLVAQPQVQNGRMRDKLAVYL